MSPYISGERRNSMAHVQSVVKRGNARTPNTAVQLVTKRAYPVEQEMLKDILSERGWSYGEKEEKTFAQHPWLRFPSLALTLDSQDLG